MAKYTVIVREVRYLGFDIDADTPEEATSRYMNMPTNRRADRVLDPYPTVKMVAVVPETAAWSKAAELRLSE